MNEAAVDIVYCGGAIGSGAQAALTVPFDDGAEHGIASYEHAPGSRQLFSGDWLGHHV
jgi:hypothetical protein